MRPIPPPPRPRASARALLAALLALAPTVAHADLGPLSGSVGVDHQDGAQSQSAWRPCAALSLDLPAVEASAAVARFDDNQSGQAWELTGGLAFPLAPKLKLSLEGTGFSGDSVSGAWRAKAGPTLALPGERSVSLYVQHYDDDLDQRADALGAEVESPLAPHLTGSLGLALERTEGEDGGDASVGLSYQPVDQFELVADGDFAAHASGLAPGLPSRKALGQARAVGRSGHSGNGNGGGGGSAGGATTTATSIPAATTVTVGVRIHF